MRIALIAYRQGRCLRFGMVGSLRRSSLPIGLGLCFTQRLGLGLLDFSVMQHTANLTLFHHFGGSIICTTRLNGRSGGLGSMVLSRRINLPLLSRSCRRLLLLIAGHPAFPLTGLACGIRTHCQHRCGQDQRNQSEQRAVMHDERQRKYHYGHGEKAGHQNLATTDGFTAQFAYMRDMLGRQPG